jgi:hypothetical protein
MVTLEVVNLPEILGPERLASIVTVRGVLQVLADLCRAILVTDFSDADEDGRIRKQLSGVKTGCLAVDRLKGDLFDKYEPNTSDHFCFNPKVRARYLEGTLTFADLLRWQPGVFVPKYYPNE